MEPATIGEIKAVMEMVRKLPLEKVEQVFQRPWAGTMRKFNVVFEEEQLRLQYVPRTSAARSVVLCVMYKGKKMYQIRTVREFMHELYQTIKPIIEDNKS